MLYVRTKYFVCVLGVAIWQWRLQDRMSLSRTYVTIAALYTQHQYGRLVWCDVLSLNSTVLLLHTTPSHQPPASLQLSTVLHCCCVLDDITSRRLRITDILCTLLAAYSSCCCPPPRASCFLCQLLPAVVSVASLTVSPFPPPTMTAHPHQHRSAHITASHYARLLSVERIVRRRH